MNILRKRFLAHVAQTSPSPMLVEVARAEGTFFYTPEGKPYFIELNSIPGMSPGSIVPKQARAMGMSLGELYDLVIADTCRK